jgi:nitroreductase
MDYNQLNQERRSINFFDTNATITAGDIRAIYDEAALAPTSFNMQPYKVVAAISADAKSKLLPAAFNQPKITEASAVLAFFGDRNAFKNWDDVSRDMLEKGYLTPDKVEMYKGMAQNLYSGKEDAFVSRNTGLFAMNFMLAAKNRGWDTHPMDGMDGEAVRKLFGLGEEYLAVMLVAIGKLKPGTNLLPRGMRRSFDQVFQVA